MLIVVYNEGQYEGNEYNPCFNMAEDADVELIYLESDLKKLLAHDGKSRKYYLITVKSDKSVDLKEKI